MLEAAARTAERLRFAEMIARCGKFDGEGGGGRVDEGRMWLGRVIQRHPGSPTLTAVRKIQKLSRVGSIGVHLCRCSECPLWVAVPCGVQPPLDGSSERTLLLA